jgi:hypothetical protein
MPNIDFSQLISAEAKAEEVAKERARGIKAECEMRIVTLLDTYTVANMQGAAIAGELSEADMAIFKAARAWVDEMIQASRVAITSGEDPAWPDTPEGVAELAARY